MLYHQLIIQLIFILNKIKIIVKIINLSLFNHKVFQYNYKKKKITKLIQRLVKLVNCPILIKLITCFKMKIN